MQILIKMLEPGAWVPTRQHHDDAGLDLYAIGDTEVPAGSFKDVRTGLAIKVSDGFWGLVRPRSSTFFRRNLVVHEGTIDPGYTGELKIGVYNPGDLNIIVMAGERIAQLVIVPLVIHEILVVDRLPETSRGSSGFGSTGF